MVDTNSEQLQYVCEALLPTDTAAAAADALVVSEAEIANVNVSSPSAVDPTLTQAEVFSLHSRPGANRTILLDFDGAVTMYTLWNGWAGDIIESPAYSRDNDTTFSAVELSE